MKKIFVFLGILTTLFVLSACNQTSNVAVDIVTVTPARTSLFIELQITDEDAVIADNGITVVLYYSGSEISRQSPSLTNSVVSVNFLGLSVGYKYTFNVYATYDGKSHKMSSGEATTSVIGGTEDNPKLITTVDDFNNIKNDLTAYYRLDADLDFENASYQNTYGTSQFAGYFDGNDHTIRNISMNLTTTYIGLFGYNKGTIHDFTVENVSLNFTTSTQNVGIIAGKNAGTIENVTLKNSSVTLVYARTGEIYIGGAVGLSESSSKLTNVNVENVALDLTITGRTEPHVGLLSGYAQGTTIKDSSATGSIMVSSEDTTYVGGLIGKIENVGLIGSSVKTSFADTSITLNVNVLTTLSTDSPMTVYSGGLIGAAIGTTVESVYALSDIQLLSATNTSIYDKTDDEIALGGLVGVTTNTIKDSFADTNITLGQAEAVSIVSFENVFVGGLAGVQVGDRFQQSASGSVAVTIYPGLGNYKVSPTVANSSSNAIFTGFTVNFDLVTYDTALSVVVTDTNVVNESVVTPTSAGILLNDYFGTFVQSFIDGFIPTIG